MSSVEQDGLSVTQAVFPMIASMMGAGMLSLPQAVEKSGYMLSGVLLGAIASISVFTLYQLVHCATQLKPGTEKSYFEVCRAASPLLGYAVEASIFLQGSGICFLYFLIAKGWLAELLDISTTVNTDRRADIFFTLVIIALPAFLASLKDLKRLNFASFFCTVAVLYLAFVILACGLIALAFSGPVSLPEGVEQSTKLIAVNTNPSDLLEATFKYIFALGCQQNMVKVFSLMKRPTVKNGTRVAIISVALGSFVYFLIANGGYIAVGNGQKKSILDELENAQKPFMHLSRSILGPLVGLGIRLAKIGMIAVLLVGYPVQMHPTRDAILTFLNLSGSAKFFIENNRRFVEICITSTLSALVVLGSLMGIDYFSVMKFIATTASCYIMYTLPSMAYILSSKKKKVNVGISIGVLLFSLFVSFFGLYSILANE